MTKRSSTAAKAAIPAFLALIVLALTPAIAHAEPVTGGTTKSVPGAPVLPEGEKRYIVKYGEHVNAEAESESLRQQGMDVKDTFSHALKGSVVLATPEEIELLAGAEGVSSVELDTKVSVFGSTSVWGLDRIDQRLGQDGQYSMGDEGAGVDVYVVDTGLHVSHTEFAGRVRSGWTSIHDGRGFQDCSGHGTHVAGTVAGTTYGVAKKANIIPVRVLECDGSGWSSTVMAGIDWAVAHHVAGQPAVMNLSVGGFTNASFDQTVQSAVNDGITVVAAAGNSAVDACGASPARVPSAVTVAATNANDAQVSWSNYGHCVDVQAPGFSVRSAWINSPTGYNTMDGTSMATPHVSGAAAVLLSRDRTLTPAQVHQSIVSNATVGIISANKGATPNRLLYLPTPAPGVPSCSNLKLGDAWAGVGTHCGPRGSVESAPGAVGPATTVEAPAVAAVEAPAPAVPDSVPAPEPVVAPVTVPEAEVAPVKAPAPAVPDSAPAPEPVVAPVTVPEAEVAPVKAPAPAVHDSVPAVPAPVPAEKAPAKVPAPSEVSALPAVGEEVAESTPGDSAALLTEDVMVAAASLSETASQTPPPAPQQPTSVPLSDAAAPLAAGGSTLAGGSNGDGTKGQAASGNGVTKVGAETDYSAWGAAAVLVIAGFTAAFARRLKGFRRQEKSRAFA